ncbi:MAG: Crp/Fnr family transcriptional regulator [Chloroflexi bacterium]|nr:Crp/Fnr family transcriptional regulator [Chloroflexota bacterium]
MVDVPACAAGVPFLRALPDDALAELGRSMRHRHVASGQALALAGEPVEHLIVVAQGRLRLAQATPGGREQVLRTLGPGEFLGELALFSPVVHEGDLTAIEPSDVCLVSRQAVQDLMRQHPEVAVRLVETLARRLIQAERAIADLGLHDVGQRLAGELLREAASGGPVREGTRVRVTVPWLEIAMRIGTTPETLSRRLRALETAGIVRQERARTVVILDPVRLHELADG